MIEYYGSTLEVASHDRVYVVELIKDGEYLRVVATIIKDRYSESSKDISKILYEAQDSPSICYLIKRKVN